MQGTPLKANARSAVLAVGLVTLAALLPATASAGTADLSGTSLIVTADPGEHNDLFVVHVFAGESQYQVTEQGTDATLTPGNGCAPTGFPNQAYCPTAGTTDVLVMTRNRADKALIQTNGISPSVTVLAGSGNDRIQGGDNTGETIDGGNGRDRLFGGGFADADPLDILIGGAGPDKLLGEGGPDKLKARDSEADRLIDCGPGDDPKPVLDPGLDPAPISC